MIEYKTFDVVYWKDGIMRELVDGFSTAGNGSFVKTSLADLKELAEDWKDDEPKASAAYQASVDTILSECPDLNEDEQFLLLMEW